VGDEALATVHFAGRTSEGKALLEADELVFRGEFRLAIRLREIHTAEAAEGRLTLETRDGPAVFELGPRAERWAERIRNPRTLIDKLGLKPDARVAVVGVEDDAFRTDLAARVGSFAEGEPLSETDVVFLGVASLADLRALAALAERIAGDGAIWVVAPKGGREPREAEVLAAGRAAGLVDTKVARFSDTHTAHRFVIPQAKR
jgi:DUF3052 family protein